MSFTIEDSRKLQDTVTAIKLAVDGLGMAVERFYAINSADAEEIREITLSMQEKVEAISSSAGVCSRIQGLLEGFSDRLDKLEALADGLFEMAKESIKLSVDLNRQEPHEENKGSKGPKK